MAPAILALAQLAPSIMGLFTKNETASKAAEAVSSVARAVTGKDTDDGALQALKAKPELLIQYQQAMNAQAVAMYQEETKRLESVNVTIRAEALSGDAFVRRWRPYYGYVVATTWGLQMLAVSVAIVMYPKEVPAIVAAMVSLSVMWSIALGVLGVAVHKRSQDKAVAAGQEPAGVVGALKGLLKK